MVLITGGTGHLGNVLVRKLIESGERVRILVHPTDNLVSLQLLPVEIFYGDVRNDFSHALNGVDAIFHLASVIAITPTKKKLLYSVNVDGTRNVLKHAKNQATPLIYVSSVHAFAEIEKGSTITEQTAVDEEHVTDDYAKSKALATKLVESSFKDGLDGFIVFPTGIFGPYDYKDSYFSRVMKKYRGGKLKYTVRGSFDFVDVRDVANSIVKLYKSLKSGKISKERYIVSGHDIRFEELPALCGAREFKVLDDTTADILSYVSLIANVILKIPAEFVPYALHTIRLNYKFSNEKLKSTIPYSLIKVEDSVHDFFNWLNELNKHGRMCYNII
ncbi:NAD-dependent epimerase/dehydratase family protein [Fervidobacterium gondwanense]|uniref:NAD-dependent epimerase/dehydratase family protein n=1 Tax=Fervidobacterium gondwanense TaxID=44754 RepID=UPI003C72C951